MIIFGDKNFYVIWKPCGLASSFGIQESLLTLFENGNIEKLKDGNMDEGFQEVEKYIKLEGFEQIQDVQSVIENLKKEFTKEEEFGLLNRLDNDTTGFVYFAKNHESKEFYKTLQQNGKISKYYIALVCGKFQSTSGKFIEIDYPIMHRSSKKMVAIKSPADEKKGTGKMHCVETLVKLLDYEELEYETVSVLLVNIARGIRHQIRVHLAAVGFPIIGDPIYGKGEGKLKLFSVGLLY